MKLLLGIITTALLSSNSFGQFGVGLKQKYLFRPMKKNATVPAPSILQSSLEIGFGGRNHLGYVGAEFNYFLNPPLWPSIGFEDQSVGMEFGYLYRKTVAGKKLLTTINLDFSLFKFDYTDHSQGEGTTNQSRIYLANSLLFGLEYKLIPLISILPSAGLGSTGYFFLNIDEYVISTSLLIRFNLNAKKENPSLQ